MNNLKYNKVNTKVDFSKLMLNSNKEVGAGAFGTVYKAYNGKHSNNKLVVKKTRKSIGLQFFSLIVNGKFQGTMFDEEVKALKYLSKIGIAPKIYYSNKEKMIYVIEKLDLTLFEILKQNKLTPILLKSLIKLLKKLQTTPFIHNDLHDGNIMYNKKNKKFYVIDWGIFKLKEECFNSNTKNTKKTKKTNNIKPCYNFSKQNIMILSNLFEYLIKKNDKKWNKGIKELLKLFNLRTINDARNIYNEHI